MQEQIANVARHLIRNCENCQRAYMAKPLGRRQRFCSQQCRDRSKVTDGRNRERMERRAAAKRGITLEEYRADRQAILAARAQRRERVMYNRQCDECGTGFTTRRPRQKLCGDPECRRKANIAYILHRYHSNPGVKQQFVDNAIRSSARKRGAPIANDKVSLPTIAARDNYRCHICGKKVTEKNWSLDHLVPVSKGGEHTEANVSLAHRSCNSRRHAGRLPAQLRAF